MKFYIIIYYLLILALLSKKISGKKRIKKVLKEKKIIQNFKEFKSVKYQNLLLVSPSPYCQCHQKTLYFNYLKDPEKERQGSSLYANTLNYQANDDKDKTLYANYLKDPEKESKGNALYEMVLKKKEFFVGGIQNFSKNPYSKYTVKVLKDPLNHNNIIRLFNKPDANLHWYNIPKSKVLQNFNKYQKYNHFVRQAEITRKDLLYKNYFQLKQKFPSEFDYMAETYTYLQVMEQKEKFEHYTVAKDNLWLVKPDRLSRGRGIHFFKEVESLSEKDIITKYIANPLLIDQKKFDIRIYVLVTGHDPLKIYMYKDGFARISTEPFNLDLEDLGNLYRHLTNVSINKRNHSTVNYKYEDFIWSLTKVKAYFAEKINLDFEELWEKIKDMAIKSFISVNHLEIEKEKEINSHLNSSNLFELYGLDIMIDQDLKPWLLEVNLSPDLVVHGEYEGELKVQVMNDLFNILGMTPYSHLTGLAMEGECHYKDSIDEAVQQSICEFTRPLGSFEHIFPRKENIGYYEKFFEKVSPNNQALWDDLQNHDFQ